MRKINIIPAALIFLVCILFARCEPRQQFHGPDDFKIRGGVNNVFYKLNNQDTVKIAYLGGSITAQPGWRVYSLQWFRENYPDVVVNETNAAIGGTGSPFGVYRLQEHVLKHKPDLVFVEFAVNDSKTEPAKITQSMEGIVRQIWQQNPEIDICFVYTIKNDFVEIYNHDSLPVSVNTMEKLAEYYNIPSINFGPEVLRRVTRGELLFEGDTAVNDTIIVFSPDGAHPYPESGHKIYRNVFIDAFGLMQSRKHHNIKSHKLKESLAPSPLVNAKMIDWSTIDTNGALECINIDQHPEFGRFSNYFETIGKGEPGDSVSFRFKGESFGFFDVIGPGTGKIAIIIDGEQHVYDRFDGYSNYWRISYKTIDGLKDTVHQVSFNVLADELDKNAILAKNNREQGGKDYSKLDWYLAKVMLNGRIVK